MKVALVNYDTFQGRSTGLYPPLHLCNLATPLDNIGHEVKIFDYAGSFTDIGRYFKEIAAFSPDLIGMSSYTPYLTTFHSLTKELRQIAKNSCMVVGGPHPTIWPKWTLEKMPQFDYAFTGEADYSIVKFLDMLNGETSPEAVSGLAYRINGTVTVNPKDDIGSLDILPKINRSFLDNYYKKNMYWDMAARGSLDMMISSRGCPYNCSFCFKVSDKFRFRSAENVMEEFEELARRGVKSIHIQDDAFTANKNRCIKIAKELIDSKMKFELKIRSRVNNIDSELLFLLKKAGVRQIIYGIESGSQIILDSMNKKTTVEMNRKAIQLTKESGIGCYAEIMIGMPGENKYTIDETIAFLLETKPIVGHIPVLYPLPGTMVYKEAKENGTLVGDWDIEGSWPWVKLPWAETSNDIYSESRRISKTTQTDIGTIIYFLKHHMRTMSIKQIKFLFEHAKSHILKS